MQALLINLWELYGLVIAVQLVIKGYQEEWIQTPNKIQTEVVREYSFLVKC